MKSRLLTLAAAWCVAAGTAFAQPNNVAGDWNVTIQSPQGSNTVRVTFKQDGEKLSGVFRGQNGELPFENGTLTGNDLRFAFAIPFQGASLEITLTGTVAGSSMTGKANFGGFAEGDWSAKRIDPDAATGGMPAPAAPAAAPAAPATTTTAGGIAGKWDVVVKTQMGDLPATAELTEAGGNVTGTLTGPQGAIEIKGTFDGNALKLSFTAPTPQGDIPITMTGDLNGDALAGKADFGGMGQAEWTAKRAKQ